ncbi:hypothetical protein A2U01_0071143, partial [Trifolium medium]|nr:hypothetical protein [Trifolium medium]
RKRDAYGFKFEDYDDSELNAEVVQVEEAEMNAEVVAVQVEEAELNAGLDDAEVGLNSSLDDVDEVELNAKLEDAGLDDEIKFQTAVSNFEFEGFADTVLNG